MASGTAALAQKLVSRKSTSAQKKSSATSKKSSSAVKKSKGTKAVRSDVPWQKLADLYNKGLSIAEISDELGLTRPKNKKGKENPFPYYLTVGYMTKLANGVEVNGKEIKIVRGSKNKKRAASKDK